ncbi:unnamed protein product [Leuciscus chuanchicus]
MASGSDGTETDTDSPYEHLKQFYTLANQDPDGKNLTFLCKICPPAQQKQVRTSTTSFSNLKRHIELKHPSSVNAYMHALEGHKGGKGKKTPCQPQTQMTLPAAFKRSVVVSQEQVDKLTIDYIVEDLQPLSKVEKPSFIRLVTAAAAAADETVEEASVQAIDSLDDGDGDDDDDDGLEPAPLSALEDPCLPPHRRCMAHTLNLVAADTKNVTDRQYNTLARPVFSKACALWNRVKRSSKASDLVEEKLKIGFVTPNNTRWNSMFLSMQRLSHIATLTPQASDLIAPGDPAPEYDRLLLHNVCDEFGLRRFSPQEIDFIHNFVSVMHPLAAALNILQGEKNTFLGYLVPTIVQLKNDLRGLLDESSKPTATEGLAACRPLIQTMIQAICKRLDDRLEEKENILAAVLLPMFKLDWVSDDIQRLQYRVMLKQEVQSISVVESEQAQTSATERKSSASSFFKFSRSPVTVTKSEVDMYLDAPTADNFNEYTVLPKLKKLFVKYNTAIPSSAPVERLFSTGGQIFRPRRNRLGDANFEKQLVLNANKKLFGLT